MSIFDGCLSQNADFKGKLLLNLVIFVPILGPILAPNSAHFLTDFLDSIFGGHFEAGAHFLKDVWREMHIFRIAFWKFWRILGSKMDPKSEGNGTSISSWFQVSILANLEPLFRSQGRVRPALAWERKERKKDNVSYQVFGKGTPAQCPPVNLVHPGGDYNGDKTDDARRQK